MKAFNINDREFRFTDKILEGLKTVETRNSRSLDSLIGQRVGIIRTGAGKATLVGYVTIAGVKEYSNASEFDSDHQAHLVKPGSKYYIQQGGKKYGYILENAVRCEPQEVTARGIVIRNI